MYILLLASLHAVFIIVATTIFKSRFALYISTAVALWAAVGLGGPNFIITDLIAVGVGFWLANSLVESKPIEVKKILNAAIPWGLAAFAIICGLYLISFKMEKSGVTGVYNPVAEDAYVPPVRHTVHEPLPPPPQKQTVKEPVKVKSAETKNKAHENSKCFELTTDAETLNCLNADKAGFD